MEQEPKKPITPRPDIFEETEAYVSGLRKARSDADDRIKDRAINFLLRSVDLHGISLFLAWIAIAVEAALIVALFATRN